MQMPLPSKISFYTANYWPRERQDRSYYDFQAEASRAIDCMPNYNFQPNRTFRGISVQKLSTRADKQRSLLQLRRKFSKLGQNLQIGIFFITRVQMGDLKGAQQRPILIFKMRKVYFPSDHNNHENYTGYDLKRVLTKTENTRCPQIFTAEQVSPSNSPKLHAAWKRQSRCFFFTKWKFVK